MPERPQFALRWVEIFVEVLINSAAAARETMTIERRGRPTGWCWRRRAQVGWIHK